MIVTATSPGQTTPTTLIVNVAGDTASSTTGVQGTPGSGGGFDLRGAIDYINSQSSGTASYEIDFQLSGADTTIKLGSSLQPINADEANTVTINGTNGGTGITVDGN